VHQFVSMNTRPSFKEAIKLANINPAVMMAEVDSEGSRVRNTYPSEPQDFLDYAEADLQEGSSRGLVNSVSNSKRAIDLQTSILLSHIYPSNFKVKRKLDLLRDLGVAAPKIIEEIRTLRDKLDHAYERPSLEQATRAYQIASLFVDATARLCVLFPIGYLWYHEESGERLDISFFESYYQCCVNIYGPTFQDNYYEGVVDHNDESYIPVLSALTRMQLGRVRGSISPAFFANLFTVLEKIPNTLGNPRPWDLRSE
jgi:hypothetical protein